MNSASTTHSKLTEDELIAVGLEHHEDIIGDVERVGVATT